MSRLEDITDLELMSRADGCGQLVAVCLPVMAIMAALVNGERLFLVGIMAMLGVVCVGFLVERRACTVLLALRKLRVRK